MENAMLSHILGSPDIMARLQSPLDNSAFAACYLAWRAVDTPPLSSYETEILVVCCPEEIAHDHRSAKSVVVFYNYQILG